ncbi:MAG: GTPase HflX [Gammaproteobacteria bacterium]|nr:GTPase HflX [Gammaproteobacteria bacterium]
MVRQESGQVSNELVLFEEIQLLAESAGAEVVGVILSKRRSPSSSTFIGSGKVEELQALIASTDATLVIVDHTISPIQERNIERAVQCRVIDRTRLILDIFASRASSKEGKLQVELAQLRHLSTRLVRGWTHLERQKGGIGLRGPGETQLETDRRLIGRRIKTLIKRLEKVSIQRELRRHGRKKVPISTVALVGYTNAGKSSLFNRLSGAGVLSQDVLFSTLDTTMRRIDLPDYGPVILSDTVGFIRDLPHGLVSSFHATLEEITSASLLLHVIDTSSEDADQRIEDVESVLEEIGAADIPRLEVYNKIDLLDNIAKQTTDATGTVRKIWLSSKSGEGVDLLMSALGDFFRRDHVLARIRLPACAGKLRASVYTRIGVMHEQVLDCGDTVLDLEVCESDVNWLVTNRDFREEYWQIKPEMVDTLS